MRRDDRSSLGCHDSLLPAGEQGLARLRRGAQQQDPSDPTPRLRLARRGLPSPQNSDLHVACPIDNSAFRIFLGFSCQMCAKHHLLASSATQSATSLWTCGQRKSVAHIPTCPQRQQQKKTTEENS